MKKNRFLFSPVLLISISIFLVRNHFDGLNTNEASEASTVDAVSCMPGTDGKIKADKEGKFIQVLPGWGSHFYKITTESDSAQIYFNQGLSMYYSYQPTEAIASFKEAARFDSTSAIIYWGQALAMGPTYNGGFAYKMNKEVPGVLQLMNQHADKASAKEKELISVMNKRYDPADASDAKRKELNTEYAKALQPLVAKYADDTNIKALYTDAVMLIHAWDFWYNDGTPKPWTPELVKNCEEILAEDPHHPGALHYYIHVTEASRKPEVALSSADSLIKLFPSVPHMVHMSSHEYERLGYYTKGVQANEAADHTLGVYDSLAKSLKLSRHVPHYFAVDTYCALSGGMYKKALQKALVCRGSVVPDEKETYRQYLYMFPLFTMVRMGKWQDVIQDSTSIQPAWSYASLLNDFAKGMAYAKTGLLEQANLRLQSLRQQQKDPVLKAKFTPLMSSPYECSRVAENILSATILFQQKKYREAITEIKNAIRAEDSLIYTEPKLWMLPARQYLGAFLMKLNKPAEAEKIYREDLVWNPGSGWSLLGLHQALKAQGKLGALQGLAMRYKQSFSEADVMPVSSAY